MTRDGRFLFLCLSGGKASLSASGLFRGFTDWHCHLLPGVDDGSPDLAATLSILSFYERLGIREVWLTPHVMEDIPNTTAALRERFAALEDAYRSSGGTSGSSDAADRGALSDGPSDGASAGAFGSSGAADRGAPSDGASAGSVCNSSGGPGASCGGPLRLHLAAEYMLDALFASRLAADDLLPLEGKRLLVETSYFNPPLGFWNLLREIREAGYRPVLAHPERYRYMTVKDYDRLREMEVCLQLNLPSCAGLYGESVRRRARFLLKGGYYRLCGTDTHSLLMIRNCAAGRIGGRSLRLLRDLCPHPAV